MYYFNRQTGDYGDAANLILVPNSEVSHDVIPEGSDSEIIDMAMDYEKTEDGSELADRLQAFLKQSAKDFENIETKETRDVDALLKLVEKTEQPDCDGFPGDPAFRRGGYRDLL